MNDDYFGVCPICHKTDGYVNVGRTHVFYCKEHKVSWCAGANLFSTWRYETEEEQREAWDKIGLDAFERIDKPHGDASFEAYRREDPLAAMRADGELEIRF